MRFLARNVVQVSGLRCLVHCACTRCTWQAFSTEGEMFRPMSCPLFHMFGQVRMCRNRRHVFWQCVCRMYSNMCNTFSMGRGVDIVFFIFLVNPPMPYILGHELCAAFCRQIHHGNLSTTCTDCFYGNVPEHGCAWKKVLMWQTCRLI